MAALVALATQGGPHVSVGLDRGEAETPALTVSLRNLLAEGQFLRTMHSGFPLYVAYTAEVMESRSNWFDRTAREYTWEYVVLYDPVRESYIVEETAQTVELGSERELRDYLARVYVIPDLAPGRSGRYYFRVTVDARTLSDNDVDEVFDWLKGEDADSNDLRSRSLLTRTARKFLVRVAPLPHVTLTENSERFEIP